MPKQIAVHGWMTVDGKKISKSIGNVINPLELTQKYPLEAVRYFLMREIQFDNDGDFSYEKFEMRYNADLANGLGNLIARVAKLCENSNYVQMGSMDRDSGHIIPIEEYSDAISQFRFNDALSFVWKKIASLDKFIDDERPWDLLKSVDPRLKSVLAHSVDQIQEIAALLEPFLPKTAEKIEDQFKRPNIKSQNLLFPRI